MSDPNQRKGPPVNLETTVLFAATDAARSRNITDHDAIHQLVVTDGIEPGRRIELGTEPIVLGRTAPANVVMPDSEVSRAHCSVNVHLGEVIVTDLNSTNGTFVDGKRIAGAVPLPPGSLLVIGRQVLRHERMSRREAAAARELDRDIDKARKYVEALLPAPITEGPIRTEWTLLPSAKLGGDAFGYQPLDDTHFAIYLMDVSGHGAGAAMLAVSVINVVRQRAIPGTDFRDPAAVVRALNAMFQMEDHGDMFFTLWYGVYDRTSRRLAYSSAGHHPSYLVPASRDDAKPLRTPGLVVGADRDPPYVSAECDVPVGSTLYVFSDGVFEVLTAEGRRWELDDFLPLLTEEPVVGTPEPERLLRRMQRIADRQIFEDDFTMLAVHFA